MTKARQLEQLEQECKQQGVRLIYDDLRSEGGLCRLRGCYYVILNRRLAAETKTRIIIDALARVRDMIESHRAASEAVSSVPEAGVWTPVTDATETTPPVVDYPESVYEEPSVGVPVGSGVQDGQS